MPYWLLKTEPNEYSWADLVREAVTVWDGVKAAPAIKNMRRMKPGDKTFIYHTGKERRIVGIAEIISLPYYEPTSSEPLIKVAAREELPTAITLKMIKESGSFADWDLVRLPRLSVVPVSETQWDYVLQMSHNRS